jgi:radical SAM-linked protein
LQNVRVFFRKTGDARFLSHLDVMRCFTRALKRSGFNVWYTQGFNTHIYLMFASPLSLGFESEYEPMDFRIVDDEPVAESEVVERLNSGLPRGLTVFAASAPEHEHTDAAFSEWEIRVSGDADAMSSSFREFISKDEIPVTRKNKKGVEKTENAVEYIKKISFDTEEGCLVIRAVLKSDTSSSLNPSLLLNTFLNEYGIRAEDIRITRKSLLLQDLTIFK